MDVMQNANEILWTSAFLNERFTEPVSPLGWSFIGALFEELALRDPLRFMGFPDADTIPATRLWQAHPYVNVEIFQIFYKPFPDAWVPADAVRYFPRGDLNYRKRAPYPTSRVQPRFLLALARHLLREAFNASPLNYRQWRRFVTYHDAQTQKLETALDAAAEVQDILSVIHALYALDTQLLRRHRWSLTYADVFYKILAQWSGDLAPILISNVPNKTRDVNAALAALAQPPAPLTQELLERIQQHAALSDAEHNTARALDAFLKEHGHRAFSLDLAQPSFREDPAQLLPLLQAAPSASGEPQQDGVRAAYQEARHQLRWWQRLIFRPVVGLARRYAQLREDQRYYWQKSLALTRRAYWQIGAHYVAQGIFAAPQDIFYATRAEIEQTARGELDGSALRACVGARQREWNAYWQSCRARGTAAMPQFLRGDAPVGESPTADAREWRGRGVSPGIARGVVRVVHDPRDLGRVGAGEILVVPSTDPAWTPVFARLGGLVMERGGVLSHGAVVAREYRLPAVAAIANLTEILHEGEWIEINGTTGLVKRIAPL
jgi:phosphohistidine swiveling domain-containing protein